MFLFIWVLELHFQDIAMNQLMQLGWKVFLPLIISIFYINFKFNYSIE
jgi:NADH:ubiquinone oxidoreductase subunit H